MSEDKDLTAEVVKIGCIMPVSDELLKQAQSFDMFRPDTRTDEQRATDRAEQQRIRQERRDEIEAEHAANLAAADPFRRAVLELHAPGVVYFRHDARCEGCDMDGYDAEPPSWPCRTYELAANWPAE